MAPISGRRSATITSGALFAVTLLLRIPIRAQVLSSVDSVNFALALERYDVVQGQPHPPGNFLYIAAAHVFQFFLRDATTSLVALSILSSALAVAGLFLLGRHIFNYATGLAAAVILLFSPVAWYYSEIAVTYEVELALVIVCVWLLYDMIFFRRHALLGGAVLAIAGGFRVDTLVFLLPIFVWATLRVPRRQALYSWGTLGAVTLAWVLPFVGFLPSVRSYLEITSVQFPEATTVNASRFQAFINNITIVWHADIWLFGSSILAIVFLGFLLAQMDRRDYFLLAVPGPALIFFLMGHFGQFGYLLVFGGPLLLLGGRVLVLLSKMIADLARKRFPIPAYWPPVILISMLTAVSLSNAYLFFNGNRVQQRSIFTTGSVAQVFGHFTASTLRSMDSQTMDIKYLIHQFKPEDTLIVSVEPYDTFGWRKLMYYFPDYRTVGIGSGQSQGVLYDATNHFAPDYLYRHGRIGEWKKSHYDIRVGSQYRNVLVFGVSSQMQTTGLTRLPDSPPDRDAYLGHLTSTADEIQIGNYHIHI